MIILGIFMAISGGIAYKKNRGIDLLVLFCLIWTVVFLGASLKLFGMKDYRISTVGLFAVGSLFFVAFGYAGRYGKYKKIKIKGKLADRNIKINKLILSFFLMVLTLFILYMLIRMLELVAAGVPLGTIHAMYLGRGNEDFFTLLALNQVHSKVIIPFVYCLAPIIVYFALTDFKKNLVFILIGTANLIIYMIATGSRIIVIFMLTDTLLMLAFVRIRLSKKGFRRIKKLGISVAIILAVVLIGFTISRKGFGTNEESGVLSQVFGEVYKYFSLCIPLSDHWLSNIDTLGIVTYGKMSFHGLLSFTEWLFVFFFKTNTFESLDICRDVAANLEIMQPIFADAKCNAFVTYLFYFYIDFGVIGVGMFSAIWGFACGKISKIIKIERTEVVLLFYLLFAQTVSMSFSRWCFFDAPYLLAFFYMGLLFVKGKVETSKEA